VTLIIEERKYFYNVVTKCYLFILIAKKVLEKDRLKNSFTALINDNKGIIYKICYLYADSDADRQDLYQEILFRVWQAYPKFRGDAKFSTWLYQVALNTAFGNIREHKRSIITNTSDGLLPETTSTGINEVEAEQLELLYKAINQLNEIERAVVVLYLDNKTYEEMETIMGIPNGALRVKMTRIKEKLKKLTKSK
jgi:RNA polymerase sigma-70 factor (ECF subfamily)